MSKVTDLILTYVPSVNVKLQPHFFDYVDTTFIQLADKFLVQLQQGFQYLRRKLETFFLTSI